MGCPFPFRITPSYVGACWKLLVATAVESRLVWLTVIGVVTTVVSFYYYLSVIVQMYMRAPKEDFENLRSARSWNIALFIAAVGTLYRH